MKATCKECGESYEGYYPEAVEELKRHIASEHVGENDD